MLFAQDYWKKSVFKDGDQGVSLVKLDSRYYQVYTLDIELLKTQLYGAPVRGQFVGNSNTMVSFPNIHGGMEQFRVMETQTLAPEIAQQHPDIKTYLGFSVHNPGNRIRFSVTPLGLKTMISYLDQPNAYIQPVTKVSSGQYLVYNKHAKAEIVDTFNCLTEGEVITNEHGKSTSTGNASLDADDQILRIFKIAISTTGEYTAFWDDGNAGNGNAQADALAQVVSTLERMNEVFETDMAVTYQLVSGTSIIYANPFSDPYNPAGNLNNQLQTTLTNNIGEANYNIGHLFHKENSYDTNNGNAGCIGCVCVNNQKGRGFSSHVFTDFDGGPYMSDFFDIDYVPHEVGHQMGGNHTFAMSTEGSGVNSEPGSGSTIMGYAGITGPNDVQRHSDPYFHYQTINQILNNLITRTCWQNNNPIAITNSPPAANAGNNFTIPPGTAYVLKGAATDANTSDVLTYCWEQINSAQVGTSNFGPNLTNGSMNRSLPPTTSPDRYIPKFSRVLNNELTETNPTIGDDWETVSNVARTMDWALTVRDREPNGTGLNGQSSFDTATITVEAGDPFTVNTPVAWAPGAANTITWNVGSTNNATINCQSVNILFSSDGGATFTALASGVANTGSYSVSVPSIPDTNNARVIVEAADNIFYAITSEFIVTSAPDFGMLVANNTASVCGEDMVTYNLNFETINGFSETTTFSASGNPAGSNVVFTPSSLSASGTVSMEISGLNAAAAGNYTITITGTSASVTRNTLVELTIVDGVCTSVANTQWQTSTTLVQFNTINNPSGKPSGYSDYTAISTSVNREEVYDLTVNMNTDGNYTCRTMVWIDWNQNCIFEDSEGYNMGQAFGTTNGPTSNSPLAVSVPADAVLGNTTMRVTTKFSTLPTACENDHDAEVEDYTINVLASLSVDEFEWNNLLVYPNPNNGSFTISFNLLDSSLVTIQVYDLRGRRIFNNNYQQVSGTFKEAINLDTVQSGVYLLNITNGTQTATKKIIIE